MNYKKYFDIDKQYFPAVTEELINKNKVSWKNFYPHETFQKLLIEMNTILTGSDNRKKSIWVEGAYGTGKSHAVFTLKEILNPKTSKKDVETYFSDRKLPNGLAGHYLELKDRNILTVFRYGSSSIKGDIDLIDAIQKSILEELEKQGIKNKGENALKDNIISWLEKPRNKNWFDEANKEQKAFPGQSADSILRDLKTFDEKALFELIKELNIFGKENGINVFKFDIKDLKKWIKDIIEANELDAIIFIWDEFTEFLENNETQLTGLQDLAELSLNSPFYLLFVTHLTETFLEGDKKKILDRCTTCRIELPNNMAFKLIGDALRIDKDNETEWNNILNDLTGRVSEISSDIEKNAQITKEDLNGILPIHPYTALVLKNIAANFGANQRSMFSFIKDKDKGGFLSFVEDGDPYSQKPLLTIDMIWDYFYVNDTKDLNKDIRNILSIYKDFVPDENSSKLTIEQRRVLKTILLLQAITNTMEVNPKYIGDKDIISILVPTEENITNTFKGDNISYQIPYILQELEKNNVISKLPWKDKKEKYEGFRNQSSGKDWVEKRKIELKKTIGTSSTSSIVSDVNFANELSLSNPLKLRYEIAVATSDKFKDPISNLKQNIDKTNNKLGIVLFVAKETEISSIQSKIREEIDKGSDKIVYIDATKAKLKNDDYEDYIGNFAWNDYYSTIENNRPKADSFAKKKKEVVDNWISSIRKSDFTVYINKKQENIGTLDSLEIKLYDFVKNQYPQSIDNCGITTQTMFDESKLEYKYACLSVMEGKLQSSFNNKQIKDIFTGIYDDADFYKKPAKDFINEIKDIKIAFDKFIKEEIKAKGQVSQRSIKEYLQAKPYGFLKCNLYFFVLAILLKSYVSDAYRLSDGTHSISLIDEDGSYNPFINFLDGIIRSNDKYSLKPISEEEKKFIELSCKLFDLDTTKCTSGDNTISQIRVKVKEFLYPLWCLKKITSDPIAIEQIDKFYNVLNPEKNKGVSTNENLIVREIGKDYIADNTIASKLKPLFTKDKCKEAMDIYINNYFDDLVQLANQIGDINKEYLNILGEKFVNTDKVWIWNEDTYKDQMINEIICQYEIINYSNSVNSPANNFKKTIDNWKDVIDSIKISHGYIEMNTKMSPLIKYLYIIISDKSFLDNLQNMKSFRDALKDNYTLFKDFKTNQFNTFWTIFKDNWADQDEENGKKKAKGLFDKISNRDIFTMSDPNYESLVQKYIKDSDNQLWNEKTNTSSPSEWSIKYQTPISVMIPKGMEFKEYKSLIDKIEYNSIEEKDKADIKKLLNNDDYVNSLNDQSQINEAFLNSFIEDYSYVIDTDDKLNELRKILCAKDPNIIDWLSNKDIQKEIDDYVKNQYILNKKGDAIDKIKNMDSDKLQKLIESMAENNVRVGIEILKS